MQRPFGRAGPRATVPRGHSCPKTRVLGGPAASALLSWEVKSHAETCFGAPACRCPMGGGKEENPVGGLGRRRRPLGINVGNRCAGPSRTAMCLQEGCAVSPRRDRGPERRGGVWARRPTLRAQGYGVAVGTAAGALAVRWGSGPRGHHDSRRGGHRAGAARVNGGRRWPGDPPGRTGSQQVVVSGAPSELCRLLTLADVGTVRFQNRQVRDTSSGGGG